MNRRLQSECPICYALDVFGDKWTLLVLRDMMVYKKRRYGDFLKSEERISTNILADRLKALLELKLITREDDVQNKGQTLYALTDKALALQPVFAAMANWGIAYGPAHLKMPPGHEALQDRAANPALSA